MLDTKIVSSIEYLSQKIPPMEPSSVFGVYIYRGIGGKVMSESDCELMERLKNGDMSAFDLIVQRHKAPLINFAYRFLGERETAEDVTQEVYYRMLPVTVKRARSRTRS